MQSEEVYEILDYESKLSQIKLPLFHIFCGYVIWWVHFSRILIKHHYLYLIRTNIPQIVFDFIIY